jgi:hypothetical protein
VRAPTAISNLIGVSRPRGACSGLFSENESSRLKSPAHVRCQQVNSAAFEKIPATDLRHQCDSKCQISPPAERTDDRSGLFPENESSLLKNRAPVRCRRVNPANGRKGFLDRM